MRMVMIGAGQVGGIIGCVIREGERLGVPTPLCRATLRVYLEIENRRRAISMHNYHELHGILH